MNIIRRAMAATAASGIAVGIFASAGAPASANIYEGQASILQYAQLDAGTQAHVAEQCLQWMSGQMVMSFQNAPSQYCAAVMHTTPTLVNSGLQERQRAIFDQIN